MNGPGSSKIWARDTPSSVVLALIFFKPPQAIVALVPKAGSLGEHRVTVAAEPLRAWGSSVVRCQKTLLVFPGEITLRRTNLHPAVKAVGCAKGSTIKSAGRADGRLMVL